MGTITINESNLKELIESTGGDQTLTEGIKEIFQKYDLKKFLAKFLQKGSTTVYFAYNKDSRTFAKAIFENGKLEDTVRYKDMDEMEMDIHALKADGFKEANESKAAQFVKFFVRNLGRLIVLGGIANFIAATILAIGAGLGVAGVVGALPPFIVTGAVGWMMATVAKKDSALDRDFAGVSRTLGESVVTSPETIRKLVRDSIKSKSDELTLTPTQEKSDA